MSHYISAKFRKPMGKAKVPEVFSCSPKEKESAGGAALAAPPALSFSFGDYVISSLNAVL
jgi:hypothetical protein